MDSNLTFHIIGDLLLTEYGETCEGRGLTPIGSMTECKANIEFIQTYYPSVNEVVEGEDYNSSYPKGCYVYTNATKSEVLFNEDPSGGSDSNSRALCVQGGKK